MADTILKKLKNFHSTNKFKKQALGMLAGSITGKKKEDLLTVFNQIDEDGSGSVSLSELSGALKKAGIDGAENMEALLRDMDANGDGQIDYKEFAAAAISLNIGKYQDELWQLFHDMDKDGSGSLELQEIFEVLKKDDENINIEAAKKIMEEMDADKSGAVDYEEFMQYFVSKKAELAHGLEDHHNENVKWV